MIGGRINITQKGGTPLFLQSNSKVDDRSNYYNAIKGVTLDDDLYKKYFSSENINYVHDQIKYKVYEMTNKKYFIDKQDRDELKVLMKSIYLKHSTFEQSDKELNKINNLSIIEGSNIIYRNLVSYLKFIKDISTDREILNRPVCVNEDKSLKYKY